MNESIIIKIDQNSSTPIYMQIVEKLHGLMVAGMLSPGDHLPSVRKLAEALQVNANTVLKAYRWLSEAGLISMNRGSGTYVLNRPLAALERQQQQEGLEHFTRKVVRDAHRLGFTAEELMEAIGRQTNPGTSIDANNKKEEE